MFGLSTELKLKVNWPPGGVGWDGNLSTLPYALCLAM